MSLRIAQFALVVRDYDEAIAYFTAKLGLRLLEDTVLSPEKRWVVVGGEGGARILLAKAAADAQSARIGDQTGGRVGFFIETDAFEADYARMRAAGVDFIDAPRNEAYGRVIVFRDLYGNKWDLIGRS